MACHQEIQASLPWSLWPSNLDVATLLLQMVGNLIDQLRGDSLQEAIYHEATDLLWVKYLVRRDFSVILLDMPLHRSRKNKMIAGVCGGLAEWLGWSPTLVRVLYATVSVLSAAFPGIIVYLILWLLMPKASE